MPIRLVRRPKSPFWIARGTVAGNRVEESTGTADRRQAEEYRANLEAQLYRQAIYGRAVSKTFAEAALSYLENGGSRRFLDKPLAHFNTTALATIGLDEIVKGAKRYYPDAGPATRDRQFFTPAAAVLKHAASRGWCTMPVLKRPEKPKGVVRWLTIAEVDRFLLAANETLRPLLVFLFYTGARIGEALWMDWKQVDLDRAHVYFPETKNGEARGVPLHPRAVAALANLKHRDGCVFRRPDGEEYDRPKRIDDTSAGTRIKTAFRGARGRADISKFRVHDCRHTWATWHYAANRDLGALMRLGGWKSEAMVMRYAHINVGELAHTIDRLPGGIPGDNPNAEVKSA